MIDSKSQRIESIRRKKTRSSVNGDISPIPNGQKLSNGSFYHKTEEIDINKSWNVMNYQDYVDYRSNEEKSLSHSFFGNSLYDFTWDLITEIHNGRQSISGIDETNSKLSSTSEQEHASTPGFIFRFYKKFGFYWNVFPKTDYCYLPGSPDYKKEISPGIPKVPNLSRYPLSSFINRRVGLKSRSVNRYDSSTDVSKSFASSTKIETGSHNVFSNNWENVEARQNIINNILSRQEKYSRTRTWRSAVKNVTHTFMTTVKRTVVMTFTTLTEAVSLSSNLKNMRIPLLLLFILLLPFLYFSIPGFAHEQKAADNINEDNALMRFISWIVGGFTSFIFLVKDSLLFIPIICQQLVTVLLTLYNTETSVQNEPISIKSHEKISVPLLPMPTNFSRELTKEELIAVQSGIIEKIKVELNGRENYMSARIDKLQEKMEQLTEDIKKISGSFEADWRNRFNQLEEEIKEELADVRKSVDGFEEKTVGNFVTSSSEVEKAVAKYHADRTGKPDYALQSSGGYIVRVRCTQTYTKTTAKFYLFNLPLPWDVFNGPETIIKPGVMPGECWAFEGSFAQVTLHLATKVKVTGFSIEHSPKELALYGHISSAPKQFSVWALESEADENPVLLGRFTFLDNKESLQQFEALEYDKTVDLVELKVESNHGHPEYTCLYRFRVHGVPPPVEHAAVNNTLNQNHHPAIPH